MEKSPLLPLDSLQYSGAYGKEERESRYKVIRVVMRGSIEAMDHRMEIFTLELREAS